MPITEGSAGPRTSGSGLPVAVVGACLRDGRGGSPTAVVDGMPADEAERRRIPALLGTSHAVFVREEGPEEGHQGGLPVVSLRFATAEGDLPACGHGTVAALAALADRASTAEYRAVLRTVTATFTGRAVRRPGGLVEASFETDSVTLRAADPAELERVLPALGLDAAAVGEAYVATLGRPRMLLPLPSRAALADLAPDPDRLRAACDAFGLLGCYVHCEPGADGRAAARLFAPSIGVPEDIANANSTACLAALLATRGIDRVAVDMGDSLGHPATISAGSRTGPRGRLVHVGGTAQVDRRLLLGALDAPPR
ncbi:PhzF family phenazine biosynthesis protein [Streptomyces sp. AN091965]|uniref:PhzF family phenazine biosynthesis protein n=1 Tax=Streptomyces sp. AN091965 TaxID=2927803 RepID=UPI001F61936D|nr:PhzF family phenazine biosynthesis protein [Streptomyces sp. AN091965]MCI3928194.1 PhzF family phenazine biosynthesis protein [Streptomyces sp. AN091965]